MRELCYRWAWSYRWSWGLAAVLGCVCYAGAAARPDAGAQQAAEATKSARPIAPIEKCHVKYFEEAVLAFERPGILGAIEVTEGDLVKEGDFLSRLKDDVPKAALAVAQATAVASEVEIQYAIAAAEVAQKEVDRMVAANKRTPGTIPDLEVQRTILTAVKTKLEVDKARHARDVNVLKADEAKVQLATYQLEAPFDGFVSRVHLTRGASVKQGDSVIKLVNTRKMKVEGQAPLRDAALMQPGMKVKVQLTLPDATDADASRTFAGKLVFVDVEAAQVLGTVRVWAEVENVDNILRAGLNATMTILPGKGD